MEVKKFLVRLPEDLHKKLDELAKEDLRSLHSEILILLQEAVGRRETRPKNDHRESLNQAVA